MIYYKKAFHGHGTVETGHQDWSKWLLFFISIFRIGQNEWLQIPLFWTSLLCTPLLIIVIKFTWWLAWLMELKDKANHKFKLNKMHSHLAKKSPFSSIRYFVEYKSLHNNVRILNSPQRPRLKIICSSVLVAWFDFELLIRRTECYSRKLGFGEVHLRMLLHKPGKTIE